MTSPDAAGTPINPATAIAMPDPVHPAAPVCVAQGAPLRLSWAQLSETGSRGDNQDRIGAARHGDLACFVVADGTGGHHGGAKAAQLVVDSVLAAFCATPGAGAADLAGYLGAASAAVAAARTAAKSADPRLADMSSTVALLVIDQAGAAASWAHLGDSRIYLLRGGAVHSVSRDHSLAQQLIDAGLTGAHGSPDPRRHPRRGVLLAAIGAENGHAPTISESVTPLLPGDALLLCSDGLWQSVDEDAMLAAIPTSGRSEDWLAAMAAMAGRSRAGAEPAPGGRDNCSAYAIRVHAAEAA